ncbi:MAG: hypothetical protein A3G33_02540 [Omnitrophica bacterium RIFCSPLOWO2_12_FULL_44_17]|uniref:Response regulatory domain-containing protein n=1 Tax=Candidatus Danuiimicrobium aquiferis TaxID=1801832 RepID=A0A1G1KWJ4_9BACT|nr:MAG: hypothetical protein A3B72_00425 [Omnitrophica bacterium RIFCSPHIGHO2_02_FULL_45_28]OGW88325.1 MAG: hypothetical protein A3E74_02400 [Omnitrophica bacterium RIFCSPHIGHO2_12_FULL_44_12]OGW97142.1 MAG: hypothetical protein A3G33_02540 [Omnitrophica bacterium RIFCSPLOWO2_12_FULL_44_17]OGX03868.1 MAG: hypothetical protein A3J12_02270 [Omnitrophica bacterium RIFCSPLOWO2_02_FULL_44_11]
MAKKILVVDDDKDAIDVISLRLTSCGYDVISANDGREAIEKAKKELPGLIIMDIVLPEMNGAEVAICLKQEPKTKHIPIIFLTGMMGGEEELVQEEGLQWPILKKSFEDDRFIKEVRKLLP